MTTKIIIATVRANADGATEASSTGLAQNAFATTATARTSVNTVTVQVNVHVAAETAGCENSLLFI